MKKLKVLSVVLIILFALTAVFTGCKAPARKPTTPTKTTRVVPRTTTPRTTPSRMVPTPTRTVPTPTRTTNSQTARANRIAAAVAKLPDVNRATVVISGNTALVGIDMKGNVEKTKEAKVKKSVEKTVRSTDKAINNVSVTADPDLYNRINSIAADVARGKPISGFAREISEILKRITPSR
ncbi:YhcN/YlaJ family sporulation lipoprotein [Caldanaerobius polysaccharolyticus]|uniref:YhcN/YlaJ family sporulation lipoprotein n=1 Tax=Caldanaerobius polysaccharolyticus TaxID=44256 RepID=UPI00047BA831|nr:YhcN/YlaJ family sporulation lipoprotein [Caldanaerobius polysaccharolyticus]